MPSSNLQQIGPVRLLTMADLSAAMELKEAAGWNQTEEDWKRLLLLASESCFGLECDGKLAATMTAICYGDDLAWIGMALTAPKYRRMGLAHRLMEHTLPYLRNRGILWAKLDATDMGVRVYQKFSFQTERRVERWRRTPFPVSAMTPADHEPQSISSRCELPLDNDAFGANREILLRDLSRKGGACIADGAFALWRPGTEAYQFGPCVAKHVSSAEALLQLGLKENAVRSIYWDLPSDNLEAVRLAKSYGFESRRKLWRMACSLRPEAKPLECRMEWIFALAGFEYG